jgi:hypothetical protein
MYVKLYKSTLYFKNKERNSLSTTNQGEDMRRFSYTKGRNPLNNKPRRRREKVLLP